MYEVLFSTTIIALVLWVSLFFWRKKTNYKRTLNTVFLRVLLPKKESDLDSKKETTKDFKEMVSLMEQLLASLKSTHSGKILKKILGQDILTFEYIAHESEIYFYVTCARNYKKLLEKQINGFYPDAIIEETKEVNIFEGRSRYSTAYINTVKNFAYPVKTYQKLESDPINTITNAFSKLDEHESAAVQILLKPVADDWQWKSTKISSKMMHAKWSHFTLNPIKIVVALFGMFFTSSEEDKSSPDNNSSALTQERAKTVDEKDDKTWYKVIMRVITTWNNKNDTNTELTNIISAFSQFSYPDLNKFTFTLYHAEKALIKNYIYRYFTKPFWLKKMILNTEEIASLFHFPHIRYNETPEIKWQNFKVVKAPTSIPKEWLLLWENYHRWVKKEIRIKTEDRFRHFYIIGQTGTGKSSTMQALARQDFTIMDPHGDLVKDLLPFVPRERADDVIVFDPSDEARPIWLNLLEAKPEERDMVAQDANNLNGCLTLMEYPQGWALTDIIRLFTDEDFRKDHVRNVKNPIVKAWWEKTFANMGQREKQEIIPYFAAKFSGFITNKMMRNIIGQTKSSFNIAECMQQNKILLLNLSKGLIWDLNSQLLGMIVVSKIQTAAMQRQRMTKDERKDFYLYIDEFQNYVTPSIESILSEARKFMAKYFQPTFSDADLINMDKFKWVMKLAVDNQPTTPFSIIPTNPYLQSWDPKIAKALIELSRLKYGRDQAFVSKEIEYRIWIM